jgi:hypothetical protein
MLKELGPRAIDTVQFNPTESPFSDIESTTWLELKREYYVEPEQYLGGMEYRLSGRGWLAALELAGDNRLLHGPSCDNVLYHTMVQFAKKMFQSCRMFDIISW